jgi:hypothetical protein
MPDTPSIVTIKRFDWRGSPEEWSNKYHFEGSTPAAAADWKILADAIIAEERKCVTNNVSFVRAYGYVAGNDNSVAQIDYTLPPNVVVTGNYAGVVNDKTPGDVAATIRWWTGVTSSRGKKVYCRKYFHDVYKQGSLQDTLATTQRTALAALGAKLIDGSLPGSFKYCGPQGADLAPPEVNNYLTTRTLKRRGKRPPTSS